MINIGIYKEKNIKINIDEFINNYKYVSIIGSGGKTSLMYFLANELASKKVIFTTSTKIYIPDKKYQASNKAEINNLWENNIPAGIGSYFNDEKWQAPSKELLKYSLDNSSYIIIEADGSKGKPLKFLRSHEPEIFDFTDLIVCVFGMSSLNKPIKDVSYPSEMVIDFLEVLEDHLVNELDIYKLIINMITNIKTRFKQDIIILLNQCDNDYLFNKALEIKNKLCDYKVYISKLM